MIVTVVSDVLGVENNGVTIAAMNLIRSLKEKGHTVRVLCPDVDRMGQEGYYIVPTLNAGPLNGYVERVGVVIARADQRIVRQAIKGADIVHIMLPFPLGRCALRIAKEEGIPVCAGFHAMAENVSVHLKMQNVPFANHLVYEYFAGFYRDCDAIHYPTQYLRDLYEGMYGKTNGYVISNGVSDAIHPVQTQRPARYEGEYLILFTGRYSLEKSHRILIDAVAQSAYRDRIRLIFAGKGPEKEKLVSYAQKLPLQPVFSFFSRPEMLKLLNEADLYVHPAEIEAEGIACLEAISCGLVPIISDSPRCATRYYAPGENNLFHYNDPADLTRRIDGWLSDPAARVVCREQCLSMAESRFRLSACMSAMERMLSETLAHAGKAVPAGAGNL